MDDLEINDVLYWALEEDSSSSSSSSSTTSTSSSSVSSCCDFEIDDVESSSMSRQTTELISDEKRSWQFNDTSALINSVEAHYAELSQPTKGKNVWNNVCNDLVSQNIEVTPSMCAKKWQNLVRSYKACKDIKNKSGRGPVRFQFFDILDNLLGNKPNFADLHSVHVHNIPTTSEVQNVEDIPASVDIGANIETEESFEKQVTKRKSFFRQELLRMKEVHRKKREQHKREKIAVKLKLKKIKLEIEERKVRVLEALVNLRNRE